LAKADPELGKRVARDRRSGEDAVTRGSPQLAVGQGAGRVIEQ